MKRKNEPQFENRCLACGETFWSWAEGTRYCSKDCYECRPDAEPPADDAKNDEPF